MKTAQIKSKHHITDIGKLVYLIREELSVSQEQLGKLLRVSGRSVARWEKENKVPVKYETLDRLMKLEKIAALGKEIYTSEGLNEFLSTPLDVFKGRTGYDMILLGEYEAVIGALASDYEGIGF